MSGVNVSACLQSQIIWSSGVDDINDDFTPKRGNNSSKVIIAASEDVREVRKKLREKMRQQEVNVKFGILVAGD
ncbi:hypothetical protein PC122_g5798 [Phytophthora cactorum]|nr:hypothetical protein PC122_g5798 [Phytophthora cactorum]